MSVEAISIKKAIPIIVVTWILSLVTTLAVVYIAPNLLPPLTSEKIADSAILTTKLADGSVTSAKIKDGAVTAIDIADGSIITVKVVDGAVTTDKIADGAVVSKKLADGTVTSTKLADAAIVTIKLADGCVTSAKILDGAVTAVDLSDGSIITAKIADGAVTTAKIADYAVTSQKLAPNAIPFAFTSITEPTLITSTTFVDMLDTSVSITLGRTSYLLIIFTMEAAISPTGERILLRAFVGTNTALPDSFGYQLVPTSSYYDVYTCIFYMPSVTSGTHTVKISWRVTGGTGGAGYRTLTVIAQPA